MRVCVCVCVCVVIYAIENGHYLYCFLPYVLYDEVLN